MSSSVSSILFIAVPAALAGAVCNGLAGALQFHVAHQVPTTGVLNPRLLVELARRPLWLLAVGAAILGLALEGVALAFGPLALIEPLLVTGILFATVFSARLSGHPLDTWLLIGAATTVVGLSAFLSLAQPSSTGKVAPTAAAMAPLLLVFVVAVATCLFVAHTPRVPRVVHVAVLAVATGLCFGVAASLLKIVSGLLRVGGLPEIFGHPALYLLCVIGPMGVLLSQNTYQEGILLAPALAVISTVDPLVGVGLGIVWLGEHVNDAPEALAGQSLAAVVLIAGVAMLSRRGAQIQREVEHVRSRAAGR